MTESSLERPVVIVSAGRSGSSVFHEILTRHPDVCWLPRGCEAAPADLGHFKWLFRMVDLPLAGGLLRRRYEPVEGYGFWDHHYPGFSRTCRDLRADDVDPRVRSSLPAALRQLVTQGRPRLVLKITGWPRVGFLKELFPDAVFVHVVRDGRSVAASLLRVSWWWGWRGPQNWRMGPLTAEEDARWEKHDRSYVALAGIEWKKIMDAMDRARSMVPPADWHTVRYEDFCRSPGPAFSRTLDECGLPTPPSFLRTVETYGLESRNPKWRNELAPAQQAVLEDVVAGKLEAYGYT